MVHNSEPSTDPLGMPAESTYSILVNSGWQWLRDRQEYQSSPEMPMLGSKFAEINAFHTSRITTTQYLLVPPFPRITSSEKPVTILMAATVDVALRNWEAFLAINNREHFLHSVQKHI